MFGGIPASLNREPFRINLDLSFGIHFASEFWPTILPYYIVVHPQQYPFHPRQSFPGERRALSTLRDIDGLTTKIQDKSSKFVVIDTDDYEAKMKEQLTNPLHYEKLDSDSSTDFVNVISQWGKKWLDKGQINEDIAQWVVNNNPKPGKAFGTIKTHKEGNPLRLITSCCGTSI